MFIIYAVILGIITGYIAGGRLRWLIHRPLHWNGLAISAFLIQIVIYSGMSFIELVPETIIIILHVISYLILLLFVFLNRKVIGIPIIGIGILLNSLAIFSNGGYMPTPLQSVKNTSMEKCAEAIGQSNAINNSIAMTGDTMLPWLCDIFHLPPWLPLSNVFSIGDIFIAVGVCLFLIKNMKPLEKEDRINIKL